MQRNLEAQAVEALKTALQGVSAIKLKEVRIRSGERRGGKNIVASIDIYGHHQVLICKVKEGCEILRVRRGLQELRILARDRAGESTPIIIAPVLSAEAQALCRQRNASFLDLAGNARLVLGEVFIIRHSLPHRKQLPSSAEPLPTSETARYASVA